MSKRSTLFYCFTVIFVIGFICYFFPVAGKYNQSLRDYYYLLTPFFAMIGGLFAIAMYGTTGSRAKTILFITLGMCSLFIGEFLYDYFQYVMRINPFPSIADIFFLLSYPLLFLGLANEFRHSQINWKTFNSAVLFLLGFVVVLLGVIVFYFGVYLAYDPNETWLSNVIAIGYGVGDLILLVTNMLVLIVAWEFWEGTLSRTWLTLFFGFTATLAADILFAIFTVQYNSAIGNFRGIIDMLYMLGYLLFAFGLFDFGFCIQDAHVHLHLRSKKLTRRNS